MTLTEDVLGLLKADKNVDPDFLMGLRYEELWLRACPRCGGHRVVQTRFGALLRPSTCPSCYGTGQQVMLGDRYNLKEKEAC